MGVESVPLRYRCDGSKPPGYTSSGSSSQPGRYIASQELIGAVNAALIVERPLLLTGEPGTGKTSLAVDIADEFGLGDVLEFHTRSDHQARDILYTFDSLRRLYDTQARDPRASEPRHYVQLQALGVSFAAETRRVVLIDEIDKAPRDFPNDLLHALDRMSFAIAETGESVRAKIRPVVVITSNSERQLPDAFLRRCVFCHIPFPNAKHLQEILQQRLGHLNIPERLLEAATTKLLQLRAQGGIEKLPGTAELLDWVRILHHIGVDAKKLDNEQNLAGLPSLGALLKNQQDLKLIAQTRS